MAALLSISFASFKSPLRGLCRSLYRSRESWKQKAKRAALKVLRLEQEVEVLRRKEQGHQRKIEQLQCEVRNARADQGRVSLQWANMPGHHYSAEMISLCGQLSRIIGFRPTPKVLRCVTEAFGIKLKVPSRDVVRNWSCRNGVAILQQAQPADDWVWMVDHSVQLGKMFVLVVLGIRQAELPSGRPLRREDMSPLAVLPTRSRDKEEVGRQLTDLARRLGTPVAIVSDGARELHEGAASLKTLGFEGVHLDDTKHKLANSLKKKLGSDERFKAFSTKLGQTTASIQQTELDHLLPPRKKEKCRFLNFDALIDWATMVEYQLATAKSLDTHYSKRLQAKLGWLEEFVDELQCWRECRHLVGHVLKHANKEGVFIGATSQLQNQLMQCPAESDLAQYMRREMISHYQSNEDKLSALAEGNIRLPCSTEVLESAFGSFKALQRDHGRGTFTSLLAVFATLFDQCTPGKIRERFSRVKNLDLAEWIRSSNLTNSTQSRRTKAYAQARAAASTETAFSKP